MQLVTFVSGSQSRVGLVHAQHPDQIIDLERAAQSAPRWTRSVLELIEFSSESEGAASQVREICAKLVSKPLSSLGDSVVNHSALQLLCPIPRPVSMRDGYAFRQHVETARRNRGLPMIEEFDHFPVFYFTNALAVTGPGDVVVHKAAQEKLDYELELAFVVGKKIRNATVQEADQAIFGLMVMNDWSARALQMEEMKLNLGPAKGKDFATSMGPRLVTLDELETHTKQSSEGRVFDLGMSAWVNGKKLSQGNVKEMRWTCAQILARVSQGVDVLPGEIIGSGTVGTGCLLELNGSKITDNLWLRPGDEVTLEIEKLGRLTNRIVSE